MTVNRILTDTDRHALRFAIQKMITLAPEMCARKFPDALVQQAFVFDYILGNIPKGAHVLNAGSWEDTAGEALKMMGYAVVDVDPAINCDLHTFFERNPNTYDVVMSTSVLEHVLDDEQFIGDCCQMLKPNGLGIFTMDYQAEYTHGMILPPTDVRLYTPYDLEDRLPTILERYGCFLVDTPDYTAKDRWHYAGVDYSFATFVFKKI